MNRERKRRKRKRLYAFGEEQKKILITSREGGLTTSERREKENRKGPHCGTVKKRSVLFWEDDRCTVYFLR